MNIPSTPMYISADKLRGATSYATPGLYYLYMRPNTDAAWEMVKKRASRNEARKWIESGGGDVSSYIPSGAKSVQDAAESTQGFIDAASKHMTMMVSKDGWFQATTEDGETYKLYEWAHEDGEYILIRDNADKATAESWVKYAWFPAENILAKRDHRPFVSGLLNFAMIHEQLNKKETR